jgi:hypothetical protein
MFVYVVLLVNALRRMVGTAICDSHVVAIHV